MEGDILDVSLEDWTELMVILGQVGTTELLAVRAARGSSRDPSGRRPGTSAAGRVSASSPRVRGTDVSIVVSGNDHHFLYSSRLLSLSLVQT